MTWARLAHVGFVAAIVLLFAWVLWSSAGWRWEGGLFAWGVGGVTLLLAIAQLVQEGLRAADPGRADDGAEILDLPAVQGEEGATVGARAGRAFAWLGGLLLALYLIGMLIAVPLFMVGFLLVEARARWPMVAGLTVLVFTIQVVVFEYFLRVAWFEGVFPGLHRLVAALFA